MSKAAWYQRDIRLFSPSLSSKKKEAFYAELHTLLEAGLTIYAALDLLAKQSEKENPLLEELSDSLLKGQSFSKALELSEQFTSYEYHTIAIGEDSGRLQEVLADLALFYKEKVAQKRLLVSSLTYPLVILFTAFLTIVFMLQFMVPMFEDVFKRLGGELPTITQWIIGLSNQMDVFFYAFLILLLGGVLVYQFNKEKEWFKKKGSSLLLKTPLVGELIRQSHLSRFCQSMQLLLSARLPLGKALALVEQMSTFYPLKTSLKQLQSDLIQGQGLSESMNKHVLYDAKMLALIAVAERSNQLAMVFERLSQQYQANLQHQSKLLGTALEPIVILLLGLVVAFILVAMYLPMFQLSSSFL